MTKILLVEDNEMNRDMLSRRLQKNGYEVVLAIDGEEGMAKAHSELPALINGHDILLICGSAWLVCILGGVIPAWRAGRLKPVEALRYE